MVGISSELHKTEREWKRSAEQFRAPALRVPKRRGSSGAGGLWLVNTHGTLVPPSPHPVPLSPCAGCCTLLASSRAPSSDKQMFELNQTRTAAGSQRRSGYPGQQPRKLMIALVLLLIALVAVLVKDRQFWFGSEQATI